MSDVPVLCVYGPIGAFNGHAPRLPELNGVVLEGLKSIQITAGPNAMKTVVLTIEGLEVRIIEPCVVRGDPEPSP